MNKTTLPSSDADRLALLERALAVAQDNPNPLLAAPTVEQIAGRISAFTEARDAITQAKASRRQAASAATKAIQMLNEYIHQIWQSILVQVRWQNLSPTVLTYYQLNGDGSRPGRATDANWVDIAKRMLAGAEQAASAGFTVNMVDMDALRGALEQAQTALAAANVAQNHLLHAQQRLIEERQAIETLIRHIVSDLRYALRDESPVQRRQRMRAYGIRFSYDEGEPDGSAAAIPQALAA